MTELTRWVEADLPPRIRGMLDAAQREEPSPDVLTRSLATIAAAGVATTLAAHAAGAGTAGAGTAGAGTAGAGVAAAAATGTAGAGAATKVGAGTALGMLKWGLVGLMGGVVVVGAVDGAQRVLDPAPAPSSTSATPAVERSEPVAVPPTAPNRPAPTPAASDALRSATAAFPDVDPAAHGAPSELAAEIHMVEQARAALREGRLDAAATAASAYRERFPAGQFAPELDYIRMEALDRQGDHAAAVQAAQELVTRHPSGPQLLRARQILEREQK